VLAGARRARVLLLLQIRAAETAAVQGGSAGSNDYEVCADLDQSDRASSI
jgi:hypothetical protein